MSGFVAPAKDCERLVVIDGCEHCCASETLEHVEAKPHVYVNLTERGFVKQHGIAVNDSELERAHALVAEMLKEVAC